MIPATNEARPEPKRIGVVVLHEGDKRKLELSLAALRLLPTPPVGIVVAEAKSGSRPLARLDLAGVTRWIAIEPGRNPREAGARALPGCDLVSIITEGTILGPRALEEEVTRFWLNPELRLSMARGWRTVELQIAERADGVAPFDLLVQRGGRRPHIGPLYASPCMLTLKNDDRPFAFERYALRSDWASAHLLLAAEPRPERKLERRSDQIGLIAAEIDRRDAKRQGFDAGCALMRLKTAYPEHRSLVRRDLRRLAAHQLAGVVRGSEPRARMRFLSGMFEAMRRDVAHGRKFAHSIAELG
jgi:hypothetical protein